MYLRGVTQGVAQQPPTQCAFVVVVVLVIVVVGMLRRFGDGQHFIQQHQTQQAIDLLCARIVDRCQVCCHGGGVVAGDGTGESCCQRLVLATGGGRSEQAGEGHAGDVDVDAGLLQLLHAQVHQSGCEVGSDDGAGVVASAVFVVHAAGDQADAFGQSSKAQSVVVVVGVEGAQAAPGHCVFAIEGGQGMKHPPPPRRKCSEAQGTGHVTHQHVVVDVDAHAGDLAVGHTHQHQGGGKLFCWWLAS